MHEIREEEEEENVSTTGGVKVKRLGGWGGVVLGGAGTWKREKNKIILGREYSKYRFCEHEKNKRGLKRKDRIN